jgi:small subunit ribosomal protein S2
MTQIPSLLEMLKAGVHFGHQGSRWHPKMEPYIFGTKNGIHVIDLEKTSIELEKSLALVKKMSSEGKVILFVGTKRQARAIIKEAAEACGMPFLVERWIGGLLTNFEECQRRLKKYKMLREQVATGEIEKYTKKEQSTFKKQLMKMDKYLSGLIALEKIPDALYIADLRVEKTALTEARRVGVPVVAVCDTNVDPTKATQIIPANDDAVNSIKMMAKLISEAIAEGKEEGVQMKAAAMKARDEAQAEEAKKLPPKKEKRALKVTESV